MLEIKTIWMSIHMSRTFDKEINEAIAEGWELVRREVFPGVPGDAQVIDHTLYAELERDIMPAEEEEPEDEDSALWVFSRRNPVEPYHCSACGFPADPTKVLPDRCPHCKRRMGLPNARGL